MRLQVHDPNAEPDPVEDELLAKVGMSSDHGLAMAFTRPFSLSQPVGQPKDDVAVGVQFEAAHSIPGPISCSQSSATCLK